MSEPLRGGASRSRPDPDGPTVADPARATGPVPVGGTGLGVLLLILIGVSSAIELVLWLSDQGWIGSPRWRLTALGYGAFWAGILGDWQPNYPGQRVLMFFTYSLLHAGPSHLLGNMVVLVWLAPQVTARMGQRGFAFVWTISVLGGAAAFGLLSTSHDPMVGASGGLFGLVGALVVLRHFEDRQWIRILLVSAILMLLNFGMYVIQDGILAWQTHAGGYLVGMTGTAVWMWKYGRNDRETAATGPG
ncbi:rhomboid family protein [Palleronia aestuarii]|uniref:Rhomboid family protein n=1 Tax=Palleronia aestuarii TaxID=568105 RepID=A0A2W7N9G7_9RHOB|nr:rhomboid family intramembrane serine protease [Palleronia aestuarii]PZX13504.1 rhomboid family protein [Palleronia aestuarii]